jgi:hypothetical protein
LWTPLCYTSFDRLHNFQSVATNTNNSDHADEGRREDGIHQSTECRKVWVWWMDGWMDGC